MQAHTKFSNMETLEKKKRETVDILKGLDTSVKHVTRNCLIYFQATYRK